MERCVSKGRARVVVTKDGPYLVSGDVPLAKQTIVIDEEGGSETWEESAPFKRQKSFALCRCGHSKSKPFCDGTHTKVKFDGTETASRESYLSEAKSFDGPAMILTDVEHLCAFARFCDPNGQVWSQVDRSDDLATREMFIRQVGNCPSGRLVAWDKAAKKPVEPELPISIGLIEDPAQQCSGPIWLRGGIPVVSADGFAYEVRNRITLCRCGKSRNKPYCDGTHAQTKFKDM
jgi:CDGSH-type Zn-finger protein